MTIQNITRKPILLFLIFAVMMLTTATAAAAQQEAILYSFPSYSTDGITPSSALIFDAAGDLYGTTSVGGVFNNGTVFELTPAEGVSPNPQGIYSSRRPSIAFSIVISSVYSMSLPTGMPMAMRVTFTPTRLSCWER